MIVPPHIVDDANLHIETMLLAMRVWTEAREAAGEPAQMPERAHFQVDGASTNWCRAPFGFLSALVADGVLEKVTYKRNPQGHTHDKVDAIFSKVSGAVKKCADLDFMFFYVFPYGFYVFF